MKLIVEKQLWKLEEIEFLDDYFYLTASWVGKYRKVTASDQTIHYAFLRLIAEIQEVQRDEK